VVEVHPMGLLDIRMVEEGLGHTGFPRRLGQKGRVPVFGGPLVLQPCRDRCEEPLWEPGAEDLQDRSQQPLQPLAQGVGGGAKGREHAAEIFPVRPLLVFDGANTPTNIGVPNADAVPAVGPSRSDLTRVQVLKSSNQRVSQFLHCFQFKLKRGNGPGCF